MEGSGATRRKGGCPKADSRGRITGRVTARTGDTAPRAGALMEASRPDEPALERPDRYRLGVRARSADASTPAVLAVPAARLRLSGAGAAHGAGRRRRHWREPDLRRAA